MSDRLRAVLARFADAHGVIRASCKAMEVDHESDEIVALRVGVRMLEEVYDALDLAIVQMRDGEAKQDVTSA